MSTSWPMTLRTGLFGLCSLTVIAVSTTAQGAEFTLKRSVIAAGGGQVSGGGFTLLCTVAEPGAGGASGGEFSLNGGFIPGIEPPTSLPTFFLSPSGDVDGDLVWQAALPGSFVEIDLDDLADGVNVDSLFAGEVYEAEVGVGSDFIVFGEFAKTFVSTYPGGQYGTVFATALGNQSGIGTNRSQLFLEFANPIGGFGTWVYDDGNSGIDAVRMIVQTVDGIVTYSDVLDSDYGSTLEEVEGFIGVTAAQGITKIALETGSWDGVDSASFVPDPDIGTSPFQLDHIQVAIDAPPPCDGDANGDGTVDPLDVGYVLSRFGCPVSNGDPACHAADVNQDGAVDPLDAGYVLARFGTCD